MDEYIRRYCTGKVSQREEESDQRDSYWIFETLAHNAILVALAKYPKAMVRKKLEEIFEYESKLTFGPSSIIRRRSPVGDVQLNIKRRRKEAPRVIRGW